MFKLLVLSCFAMYSIFINCMEDKDVGLNFSQLDHAELTEAWKTEYYEYAFFEGQCINCKKSRYFRVSDKREIKLVLGPKGCQTFGEPHGFCKECLHVAIHPVVNPNFNKSFFSENTLFRHVLKDQTTHFCKMTKNGIDKFVHDANTIPEGWEKCFGEIKEVLMKDAEQTKKRRELSSLPHLCKTCNLFKFKLYEGHEEKKRQILENNVFGWSLVCAGCGGDWQISTTNCSILHCPTCSERGVNISTCAYCFQIMVDGKVEREGYKPTPAHQCPSSCNEYFHGTITEHRLPGKINLFCKCDAKE